jgi:hypothetical protein
MCHTGSLLKTPDNPDIPTAWWRSSRPAPATPGDPDVAIALARRATVSDAKAIASVMLAFRANRVS